MLYTILQTCLILFFPLLALRWYQISAFPKWLSPVVQCYAAGIVLATFTPFPIQKNAAEYAATASILPALPLLLFSTRLEDSWRLTGKGLLSFILCCISGMLATGLVAVFFASSIPDTDKIAGMLTGLYTGGTVNLQALSIALDSTQEMFILLQAADIVVGGIYLLLLMSILPPFLLRFYPAFQADAPSTVTQEPRVFRYKGWWRPVAAAVLTALLAIALVWLMTGAITNNTLIILLVTTISIAASFLPEVRSWQKSYDLGEYLLLVFSVAVGCLADFSEMIAEGKAILGFSALALVLTILGHFLLARLFRIDRDTLMVSSVAALFGPVFVGQIVSVTQNKRLLAPGIALALFGFAIGNYLGVSVAWLVGRFAS